MLKIEFVERIRTKDEKVFAFLHLEGGVKTIVGDTVLTKLAESRKLNIRLPNWTEALVGCQLDAEASKLTYTQAGEAWGDKPDQVYKHAGYRCLAYPQIVGKTNFERLLLANRANGSQNIADPDDE